MRDYEPHLQVFLQAMEEQGAGFFRLHDTFGLAESMRERAEEPDDPG